MRDSSDPIILPPTGDLSEVQCAVVPQPDYETPGLGDPEVRPSHPLALANFQMETVQEHAKN